METIADDITVMRRTPLEPAHVAALRKLGTERRYATGEMIADAGQPMDRFIYVEDGEIEVVDAYSGKRLFANTLGPTQFVGEIAFLSGGAFNVPFRAARDTRTTEVPRAAMLRLMADVPEMSDIILSVFTARRRRQFESNATSLVLLGAEQFPAIQEVASFLSRNRIPFQSFELDSAEAKTAASDCAIGAPRPAVIFGKGELIDPPTPRLVAEKLGLDLQLHEAERVDLLIVGGGPAGVAAAVYAGAEGLSALLVEDVSIGGQAGTSSRIENYMGFPTGISGADLVWRGQVQAMKFGTRFAMPRRVTALADYDDQGLCATIDDELTIRAGAVLVATGVQYRRLPLPRLEEFEGKGVYYAATEMESRFCSQTEAVIIGGGNSAGQAAMYLSRSASHVHLLVRGESLAESMSDYLRSRLENDERITIHYKASVTQLHGEERLEAATVDEAGEVKRIETNALFVMVGAAPNSGWLSDMVKLDAKGFVHTGEEAGAASPYATSHPRIFAVGDVRVGSVKRVASAVGEGSVVVSSIWALIEQAGAERAEADQQEPAAAD